MRGTKYILAGLLFISTTVYAGDTGFSYIKPIMSAEGVSTDIIDRYQNLYNKMLKSFEKELSGEDDIYDKHEKLFELLHEKMLNQYKPLPRTTEVFSSNIYNCVTASLLYYACCKDLGLPVSIFRSPGHVYLAFNENQDNIIVELTDPVDGFDFSHDEKEDYIEFLLRYKLITINDLKVKGIDAIYDEYVSKSEGISINRLMAICCTNNVFSFIEENKIDEATEQMISAIGFSRDSATIEAYKSGFYLIEFSIMEDIDKSLVFLTRIFTIPSVSAEMEDAVISFCELIIESQVKLGNIDQADSLFRSLSNYLVYSSGKQNINKLSMYLKSKIIYSSATRGDKEKAYTVAKELFEEQGSNSLVQDIFVEATGDYCNYLFSINDLGKTIDIADTLYKYLPEIKSVQEMYKTANISRIFHKQLYFTEPEKTKEYLLDLYKKEPMNIRVKLAVCQLYHEFAMAKIRDRKYKEAIKLIEEGLLYDPDNSQLNRELKLTKDLL